MKRDVAKAFSVGVATKSDIQGLATKLSALEGKLTLLVWPVGLNVAATVTMLVLHW